MRRLATLLLMIAGLLVGLIGTGCAGKVSYERDADGNVKITAEGDAGSGTADGASIDPETGLPFTPYDAAPVSGTLIRVEKAMLQRAWEVLRSAVGLVGSAGLRTRDWEAAHRALAAALRLIGKMLHDAPSTAPPTPSPSPTDGVTERAGSAIEELGE